jgi:trk system potassium uptake protein TrkA
MRVIVVGAGEVGYQITKFLAMEGIDVVVVEKDPKKIGRVSDELDVATIVADGCSPHGLKEAGAENADIFLAVTDSDETNMIACMLAKAMLKIPRKIARLRNPEYFRNEKLLSKENLDINPAISPEMEVANAIIKRLETPFATDVEELEDGLIKVIGFRIPEGSDLTGKTLKSIPALEPPKKFLIGIIERDGNVTIPTGDDTIEPDDVIYMPVKKWEVGDAIKFLGTSAKPARKIMIAGGGRIGYYIASYMESKADVKVIERNAERCKFISKNLHHAVVLHGDGSDESLLIEENIADMDAFVSVSNNEELNIMASVLAKRLGAKKTITIVNRNDYLSLGRGLGLQAVLSPRLITASSILKYVRKGEILSLTAVAEEKAEIIEARIGNGSKLMGKAIEMAKLPKSSLVGAIIRDEQIIIPSGSDVINEGDKVIIFTLRESIPALGKLLG